ncbi:8688_t:CDS:2 [Scutellospora calospora]|uniref:8688_t:CDS:1 n=1 Tax=Scutellospora calospora TaxID=85575 RepID=A0ACA9L739_9GLOM|nr:8688_t:CDS:2 [Scutellospora calospora]
MIQFLPNELQIQILNDVINYSNFEYFCILRTVCKKWNTFIPLIIYDVVISRLNSGLKLEFTDWNETKWSKEIPPTYDDYTKTFTFLFDTDYKISDRKNAIFRRNRRKKIDFIAFVENTKNLLITTKFGIIFGKIAWPKFINGDTYKHDFDRQNNVCFKRITKNTNLSYLKLSSFTIAAWKLYYILDCIQVDGNFIKLKKGFQYFCKDSYFYEVPDYL